jgi:hypothetical protein
MDCYLQIGRILQEEKNYSKAVIAYKLMLVISWQENDHNYETLAYENLAM